MVSEMATSHLTQAAFVVLFAVSLWLFAKTLNRRLFALFPKPWDIPDSGIANGLRRMLLEVLLQYRVVRDRPMAGILHAIVLWGFVAFAGASLEHLSLGVRGLEHASHAHGWYGAFVAVWAVGVLIAISALAFRRFVLRPKALGDLSPSSALVAALIALLMVTYLLGWGIFPLESLAWKTNWWIHTVAFLALLVVIPRSKHLHLVLSPFTVFFRSDTTSVTRALRAEDDNDIGLVRFKDLQWKDVLDLNTCVECGRCTQFCPANITGGSLSPKHVILDMQRGLLHGGQVIAGPAAEKAQGAVWIAEEDLYQCLSCGSCEYVCPVGIEHVGRKILDLRRGLISEGRIGNEKVVQLFTTMERAPHNPWGIGQDTRQKFIETKHFPIFDGTQTWLFWLGCGLSFDSHGHTVALAMRQVLDAAGVSWGVLHREACCGEPARRAGNEYLYLQLAEELTEKFKESRVKNIVSCCPHCTTALDRDYRQNRDYAELGIRVVHHTELLQELVPKLPLKPSAKSASYHDPCYLARHRGITAAPRQILARCGVSIQEPEQHGGNTFCCGAGGAQLFITDDRGDEKSKERVNQHRFAQLAKTQVSTLAVACPHCATMLTDAAGHARRDDVAIMDVVEIVASCLHREPVIERKRAAAAGAGDVASGSEKEAAYERH